MINWDLPLEAVNKNGSAIPVIAYKRDGDEAGVMFVVSAGNFGWPFKSDGNPVHPMYGEYTIRNRHLQKTLEQRMEDLVRRMAEADIPLDKYLYIKTEARSIVTELDRAKRDDADLAMAREVATGRPDPIQSALAAIRLMREKGNG